MNTTTLLSYPPDKKIQNYVFSFKAKIGKGAYGTVYLGKNEVTSRPVALKVIEKKILSTDYAQQLITQEIEIMKKIDNCNTVKLIDVLHTVNNTYIISEYCNGGDLREYLKSKKSLLEEDAIKVIKNIISGLKELLHAGIIHRDIKPANILIHDQTFKITDFGFAREVMDHNDSIMNSLVGTPLYMSPQILKRQSYTSKCDIWSLGLILYEMIYGVTPWHSNNLVELMQKLDSKSIKPLTFPAYPKITEQTKDLIKQCLHIREERRIDWTSLFKHPLINLSPDLKNPLPQLVIPDERPPMENISTQFKQSNKSIDSKHRNNNSVTQHYIPNKYADYYNTRTFKNYLENQGLPRVKTDINEQRERSQSSALQCKTQTIETPPIQGKQLSGNTSQNDSIRTPSALNSHSTNATISSGRPQMKQAFETTNITPFIVDQIKHEKKRSIFQEPKAQSESNTARLKRTTSLSSRIQGDSSLPYKNILYLLKMMSNQIDLIPSHIDLKKELLQVIESQKKKTMNSQGPEQIYSREDQLKCKLMLQNLNSFMDRNKKDNFIVQIQVMQLMFSCLYNIISTNMQSKTLIVPNSNVEHIKKLSEIQQSQLQMSPQELQQQIYLQHITFL